MGHRIIPVSEPVLPPRAATSGFTLIELLIAVAVLAALSVGASLVATGRGAGVGDADRFARLYATMRQQAVLGQGWRGIALDSGGSRTGARRAGVWQMSDRVEPWRGRMVFLPDTPPLPATGGVEAPQIVFLPNGQTSAFGIGFTQRGRAGTIRCRTDGWAGLQCTGG